MIQIDQSKVRHVTEPGYFGNPDIDFDCITLEYAHDLVREANIEIKELYRQIAAGDNEKITEKIPLTLQNVCSVVAAFTRLPAGKVLEYGKKVFEDKESYSIHFTKATEQGPWVITSAIKIKDADLVTFIRNFSSMMEFGDDSRMPRDKFAEYIGDMFRDFKKAHNLPD